MTDDISREALEQQENAFVFDAFTQDDAWKLGSAAVDAIHARGIALAIQIDLGEHTVFKAAIGGVSDSTDEWLAGKARTARMFESSSLLVRFRKDADPSFLEGIDQDVYRTHGGAVPIRVAGLGIVGTITGSGLTDLVDHAVAIEALQRVILK